MKYAAALGTANCDLLYGGMPRVPGEGTEVFAKSLEMKLGGGAPAVMIHLHRLGVPTALCTFLGKDMFSSFVEKEIARSGMPCENLYEGDKMPVTVTSVMITPEDRTFASYQDEFAFTKEMEDRACRILSGASHVRMQLENLNLYRRLKKEHPEICLVLDFGWDSVRPAEELEPYFAIADYYTPNLKEALAVTGTDSPKEAARVLKRYFEVPIVKLGKEGCLVYRNGEDVIIPPLPGTVSADATGAGDAFLSGFLYGLYHGYDVLDSVRFGNVLGGRCVEKIGCLESVVTEEDLLRDAQRIRSVV